MTKREGAIISAYTGIMIGSFSDLQEYGDELMGEYTFTHHYGDRDFANNLKEKSKPDFMKLMEELK